MTKHLDYETWLRHLAEKEQARNPPGESERLRVLVKLLERFSDIYQM